MSDFKGWIKLDRGLLDWDWFKSPNTLQVWIVLLLKANIEPLNYKGIIIDRGSLAITQSELMNLTGLERQPTRTALFHLVSTNAITIQRRRSFSIISIVNYDKYQSNKPKKQPSQQPSQQPTLFNNKKHSKECKKEHTLVECDSKRNGQSDANGIKASHPLSREKEFARNIPLLSWDDD